MSKKVYKYKKYKDFKDKLEDDEDMLLMSRDEFIGGGKNVKNIPCCYNIDGEEPVELNEDEL